MKYAALILLLPFIGGCTVGLTGKVNDVGQAAEQLGTASDSICTAIVGQDAAAIAALKATLNKAP